MSDDPAEKTALVQAIESGVVDAVREAVASAGDADAQRAAVNAEAPGTALLTESGKKPQVI